MRRFALRSRDGGRLEFLEFFGGSLRRRSPLKLLDPLDPRRSRLRPRQYEVEQLLSAKQLKLDGSHPQLESNRRGVDQALFTPDRAAKCGNTIPNPHV
jgi:hypothetical protein